MIKLLKKISLIFGLLIASAIFGMAGMRPGGPGDALFTMPTPEEMQAIEEFLQTLSPEEIDQLTQLGEQIIKEAEAEGRPLFADMPTPVIVPEKPSKEPTPKPTETPIENPKKELHQKVQKMLKSSIISLLETMSMLRQKASSDEKYSNILLSIHAELDTFIYYLHVMKDSKHLANITEEEFAKLKQELLHLEEALEERVITLQIPSLVIPHAMTKHEREARRRAIRTAETTLHECKEILQNAFVKQTIISECEKLLKKYEPEALKIKEDQTKKSQIADGQINRLQATNTGKIVQTPTFSTKTIHYTPAPRASSVGTTIPSSYANDKQGALTIHNPSSKTQPAKGTQKGTGKKNDGSPEVEKGGEVKPGTLDENQKTRAKIKEQQEKMKEKLKEANKIIIDKGSQLNEFLDRYMKNETKNPEFELKVKDTFDAINFEMKHAQKAYNDAISKAESLGRIQHKKTIEECKKYSDMYTHQLNEFTDKLSKLYESDLIYENDAIQEKLNEFDPKIEELEKHLQKFPPSEKRPAKVRTKRTKPQKKTFDVTDQDQINIQEQPNLPEIPTELDMDDLDITRSKAQIL